MGRITDMVGLSGSPIDSAFDVTQLWSDDMTFSKSGYLFCGKPFPRSNNIRLVDRVLYAQDYNGANKDELDVMPSKTHLIVVNGTDRISNATQTLNSINPYFSSIL